jgi:diguanylate cyclase (GGDEF)-like protein
MAYLSERTFEGNPRSIREWGAWWKDRFREFIRTPEAVLIDAAAGGERLVAQVRLAVTILILAIPVTQVVATPLHSETIIGLSAAGVAFAAALIAYRIARSTLYRPAIGFVTSALDVTLVSMALASFLLIDQPHTVVNSKVVFEAYFLSLSATVLRFDPRIAAVAGLVAVLQYLGLVAYTANTWDLNSPLYAPYPYGMFSWSAQYGRLVLLACAGIVVTAVTLRARGLQWLSARDRLTGLLNRSVFDNLLSDAEHRARRGGYTLSILLLGIDGFRAFNQRYGFAAGDAALRVLAAGVRQGVRQGELVARYGSDVIAVLLPDVPVEVAMERARDIRNALAGTPVRRVAGEMVSLNLSAGLAVSTADGRDLRVVLDVAEARLKAAKQGGGNRMVGLSSMEVEGATE